MLAIQRKDGLWWTGMGWTNAVSGRATYLKSELPPTIGAATLIDAKEYRVSRISVLARVVEV